MTEISHLWGIDLGGTKIEGVIIDSSSPEIALCRLRKDTEASLGYDHILSQIASLVSDLERASNQKRPHLIGMGTPGAIDPATGTIKNSNTTCLNGRSFRSDLTLALGCDVILANDANCFALAEATWGAAQNEQVVFGIILGTGVGGGIVVNGQVINGRHGIAGEWGHNPLRGESTPCYCGRSGCVETVISGPALERYYQNHGGENIRLPEIAERAFAGEELASATLAHLRVKFGEAIAAVINILDPDALVIGGGCGKLPLFYEEETREAICRYLFNPDLSTRILRPALGDSAGVFGAAALTGHQSLLS